ncbi:MAG: hypothetical protein ABFC54_05475 [Thermoguttaceae bacterium]
MAVSPTLPNSADSETWIASLSEAIHDQRERMREYLASQQARLEQAASFIEQQLRQLEGEFHESQAESQPAEMEELRQANLRIVDLQEQLAKARSTTARRSRSSCEHAELDWEAEKKRILAALEADAEPDDEIAQTERMTVVEVLRTTDEVIAAKDDEIESLKRRLGEAERALAGKTSDRELVEQAVNSDAVIREEREQLKRLQAEWREKLRQAEVELALERAKIARQRAEIEESRSAEKSPQEPTSAAPSVNAESSRH